ncbi:MAG: alanine--glyoxylate aminotransferase family protein [Nitrospirae bacterium]|nr:MAG: alanine--glyoxylate aminotransferase family protein [Nitrospirota bacterium]
MIFLTPEAAHISTRVRAALQRPALSHEEPEFAELLHGIRQKLLRAFVPGAESDYTAVIMTGSGSMAVEAALLSSLPHGKRALVINNGVYGELMASILGVPRLGVAEFKLDWGARPDPEKLRLALRQHPEVYAVAMVHHETTTGLINPVKEIAEVVDSQNRVFIVDAVSGLGGEALDIAGPHLYMVAGTAQGGIQGVPGVSFVLVRKGFMERMKGYPKRSWYLYLPHYYENEERGRIPFTPAVQAYVAFDEALSELLEEGLANRILRYKKAAAAIRHKMSAWGLTPVLPLECHSNGLTAYHLPSGLSYETLHARLKEQGYVIASGQGPLASKIFRVANMGALSEADIEGFLSAFQRVLETAAVR